MTWSPQTSLQPRHNYEQLKESLRAHLKPKSLIIAERYAFHRRNQNEGETIATYMAELRKLADKCEFGAYLSAALRDRLVCGIRSEVTQRRLLAEEGLTLDKAYSTAHSMEAARIRAGELQSTSSSGPAMSTDTVQYMQYHKPNHRPSHIQSAPAARKATQFTPSTSSCWRCGKGNHTQEKCFYRRQRCNMCGQTGHIRKMCKIQPQKAHMVQQGEGGESVLEADVDEELPLWNIATILPTNKTPAGYVVTLEVDSKPLRMELDTGASVSLISAETWNNTFPDVPLEHSDM